MALSSGQIAGITIGILAAVLLAVLGLWYNVRRRRIKLRTTEPQIIAPAAETTTATDYHRARCRESFLKRHQAAVALPNQCVQAYSSACTAVQSTRQAYSHVYLVSSAPLPQSGMTATHLSRVEQYS